MVYQYKFTPLILSDIDDALDYISGNLSNMTAAEKLYQEIKAEIERICARPYSFLDCSYYLVDDENIRHGIVGSYVLIFEVSKEDSLIRFLRFLYGGRNIKDMSITS